MLNILGVRKFRVPSSSSRMGIIIDALVDSIVSVSFSLFFWAAALLPAVRTSYWLDIARTDLFSI